MRNRLILIGALGLALFASPALAQTTTTGAIQGVVSDDNGGLAGVTVVATSSALQGSASELTDSSGSYVLSNLPPGHYEVMFYYQDIKVRNTNVIVSLGKMTQVNAKFAAGAAKGEEIVIKQRSSTIDVGSAKQSTTITSDYTNNVPVQGRTYEGVLGAAAGSTGDDLGVSFSGSGSVENSYVIDGINTTGLTYGTVGAPLLNDFIQEVEVITGGYNAEYGRSTGGVVNIVTKSGGNEFHGTVFSNFTPIQAERDEIFVQGSVIDGDRILDYRLDFGFEIGGPIVRDKVWFYVGFAPVLRSDTILRQVGTNVDRGMNGFEYVADSNASAPGIQPTSCTADSECPAGTVCDTGNGVCIIDADGIAGTRPTHACELNRGGISCEGDGVADVDPATGFALIEEVERKSFTETVTQYQFTAKVNFAVNPDHQGQISVLGMPTTGDIIGVNGTPTATQWTSDEITTDAAVKWTSKFLNNRTEVDVVVGWHHGSVVQGSAFNGRTDGLGRDPAEIPRTSVTRSSLSRIGRNPDQPESDTVMQFCTDNGTTVADAFPTITNCPVYGYAWNSAGTLIDETEDRFTGKLAVTERVKAFGHHEIKIGFDFEDNYLADHSSLTGGKRYTQSGSGNYWLIFQYAKLEEGGPNSCGFWGDGTLRECDYLEDFRRDTNTFNWSGFIQDKWQILPNLTVNAGLRYEQQRLLTSEHIRDIVDPLSGSAIGEEALVLSNLLAPRIGVLYDWTREGRSKVYANWGRFYESIPMDINNRAFGGETFYQTYWRGTGGANQCGAPPMDPRGEGYTPTLQSTPDGCPQEPSKDPMGTQPAGGDYILGGGDPTLGLPSGLALIEPGLGPQYLDELVLGGEYELFEDFRVGLSYQNRRLGQVIEDVSTDGAITYIIANPGSFSQSEQDSMEAEIARLEMSGDPADAEKAAWLDARLEMYKKIRQFDKPRRDYHAVTATAYKRFSRSFFVQGSYTYSVLEGNYPGLYSPNNGQLDPNITSQYDLIELLANRDGALPGDRPHSIKIDGYYTFDLKQAGELTTGVRLRAISGLPIDTLGAHPYYGPNESFVLPRGSFGRTDFQTSADLRLQYGRKIGRDMRLAVFFDLYNVFNMQTEADVDMEYTQDYVNPIIGGDASDLNYLKVNEGSETDIVASRKLNYGNTSARQAPLTGRFGVRLEF